jgi:hypothetical protein
MNQTIIDSFSIGTTLAGSGVCIRLLVGAAKMFVKDVLPALKKSDKTESAHQCKYHESMSEVVEEFKKSSEILIRIEVRLEERLKDQLEMNKNVIELFDRMRNAEKNIAVLENSKIKI